MGQSYPTEAEATTSHPWMWYFNNMQRAKMPTGNFLKPDEWVWPEELTKEKYEELKEQARCEVRVKWKKTFEQMSVDERTEWTVREMADRMRELENEIEEMVKDKVYTTKRPRSYRSEMGYGSLPPEEGRLYIWGPDMQTNVSHLAELLADRPNYSRERSADEPNESCLMGQ